VLVVALYEFGSSIRNFCGRGEVLLGKLMMQFNKEKGKFRNLRVGFGCDGGSICEFWITFVN